MFLEKDQVMQETAISWYIIWDIGRWVVENLYADSHTQASMKYVSTDLMTNIFTDFDAIRLLCRILKIKNYRTPNVEIFFFYTI